ncbi:MAG TPA: sulfurtransferase TusA family protein [Firmicutes bacterium]|nr:sulfurtransferase TusA family protein [Bacillota bacterium]
MPDNGKTESAEVLDARGLLCPMPIVRLSKKMREMKTGAVLEIWADDEGAASDIPAWCEKTGNQYLGTKEATGYRCYYVRKVG